MPADLLRCRTGSARDSPMYLRQLKYFTAIAQAGSFSAAARLLHISQPALGYQIKQLEQRLGVRLLNRHSRGVTTTKAGAVFLEHVLRLLDSLSEAERSLSPFREKPPAVLHLGAAPTPGRVLVPELLAAVLNENVRLEIRQGFSDEFVSLIENGALDAALCYDAPSMPEAEKVPLYSEDLFVVGNPDVLGPLAAKSLPVPELPLRELSHLPLVLDGRLRSTRRLIEREARAQDLTFNLVEVEPTNLKRELIMRHGRCAIVPYGLFHEEIAAGVLIACRVVAPTLTRVLFMVTAKAAVEPVEGLLKPHLLRLVDEKICSTLYAWRRPTERGRQPSRAGHGS